MALPRTTRSVTAVRGPVEGHRLQHIPALDGLRGVAVVAVVLFHGEFTWLRGGFLGVSLFFTLSGFLITSLLLREQRDTGRIRLGAFWGRRVRRLLPASWATLTAVVLVTLALAAFTRPWRADVLSSFANIANWHLLSSGDSYAKLFQAPSPVEHFWSLSIEEQLYLFVPVLVAVSLKAGRGRRHLLAGVLVLLIAGSVVATLRTRDVDLIYYGTHTRAAELLMGALLAVVASHRRVQAGLASRRSAVSGVTGIAGVPAALLFTAALATATVGGSFVAHGGLVATAALSSALILAAVSVRGPLGFFLAARPLQWLGRVSYGIYLFHWPIMVWLRRSDLPAIARFAVAATATLVLAGASSRWFELPLRRHVWPHTPLLVGGLALALVGFTWVAPVHAAAIGFDAAAIDAQLSAIRERAERNRALPTPPTTRPAPVGTAGSAPPTTRAPGVASSIAPASSAAPQPAPGDTLDVPTLTIAGDSVAQSLQVPLAAWAADSGRATFVEGPAVKGCGFVPTSARFFGPTNQATPPGCRQWKTRAAALVRDHHPDIVVLTTGLWDLLDARTAPNGPWRSVGDPTYDPIVVSSLQDLTDAFASGGALVIWLSTPDINQTSLSVVGPTVPGTSRYVYSGRDNERVRALNRVLEAVVASRPKTARLLDFHAWMSARYGDTTLRPDGMHYAPTTSASIGTEFLGPGVAALYSSWRTVTGGPSPSVPASPGTPRSRTAPRARR